MKKLLPALLFAVLASVCYGQQNATITLSGEVKENTSDQDASVYFPKTDQNDKKCALVKVTPSQKLRSPLILEVGGLGVVAREEKPSGEVWFYVPAQVKNLTFKCAGYTCPAPIPVVFRSGCVYPVSLKVTNPAPAPAPKPTPTPAPAPSAEDNSEHLVFKGVPINGSLSQYVKAMQSAGFKLTANGGGSATLVGDFAGYKGCTLKVSTVSNHDLVCTIKVSFSKREQWRELYGDYSNLKSMLTQKYGKPSSCSEAFDKNYVNDDNTRMYYVKFDNCKYVTTYNTSKGTITLRIDHIGVSSCFVSLTYSDKINSSAVRNTALNDL